MVKEPVFEEENKIGRIVPLLTDFTNMILIIVNPTNKNEFIIIR
jgi:hypothetical protein